MVANERLYREKGGIMIINERCRENNGGVAVEKRGSLWSETNKKDCDSEPYLPVLHSSDPRTKKKLQNGQML